MKEPKVTDVFRHECSEKFGIRPTHALEAIAKPDQTTVLEQDDLVLRIHSKVIEIAKPPFHLVVVERMKNGESTIEYALKAYSDLCDDITGLAPNDILESIAERFGLPIRVGATQGKFIWAAKVPIDGPNDIGIIKGQAPSDRSFSQHMTLRIDKGPPMVAEVAMAYCLDTDAYVAWLDEHKP